MNKNNSLKYFIIPYFTIIVIMFLFNLFNYRSIVASIETQTINSMYSDLTINNDRLTYNLNEVNNIITQIENDQNIFQIAFSNEITLYDTKSLTKKISAYTSSTPLIDNVILYFDNSNIAIDNSNAYYMDTKKNLIKMKNKSYEEFKSNYLTTIHNRAFITLYDFCYLTNYSQDTNCIIASLPAGSDTPIVQVIILLNTDEIRNIFPHFTQDSNDFINIINQEGKFIFQNASTISPDIFKDFEGFKIKKLNNGKHMLFHLKTKQTPWSLVAIISYDNIMKNVIKQRDGLYAILFLGIFSSGIIAVYFAYIRAKNVKKVVDTNEELSITIENNKPFIKREFLRGLVLGEITQDEKISIIMSESNTHMLYNGKFAVLLIKIEFNCIDEDIYAKELFLRKFIIQNVMADISPNSLYTETSFDSLCFILQFGNMSIDSCNTEIEKIFDTIDNILVQNVSYDLRYTCGNIVNSVKEINISFFIAKNNLILDNAVQNINRSFDTEIYYPLDLEISLINAVNTGSEQSIVSIFNIITKANESISDITQLFNYLFGTLKRIINDKKHLIRKDIIDLINNQPLNIQEYKSIFIMISESVSSNNSPLLNNIKKYIDQNFYDTQLSRNKIAGIYNITEEYISILFKKYDNTTFLNYVDKIRIKHACEFLKNNPSADLEDVSNSCGYASIISFRRSFKKITNTVPSEYRSRL